MGLLLSSSFGGGVHLILLWSVSLFDQGIVSSSRPARWLGRRAQELSRLAVAPAFPRAASLPGHTLTASSTTARLRRSERRSEGSSLSGAGEPRRNLVSGGSKDPNHDAAMRIGSEAPKRRAHSSLRHESHGNPSGPATSNRHRRPSQVNRSNRNCRIETVR
jgi:hypothetical protein